MSDFSYDDQECPQRGPGLKHVRKSAFDIDCQYCEMSVFSANSRFLFGGTQVDLKPTKDVCQFWTCDVTVTIRAYLTVHQTLDLPIVDFESWHEDMGPLPETAPNEVVEKDVQAWFCMEHEAAVKSAPKRKLKVRRTVEGWFWVDVIDHIRFAA